MGFLMDGLDAEALRVDATLEPANRLLRSLAGGVVQPWVYLNEYAVATGGRLAALQPDVVHAHDLVTLSAGAAVSRATGARPPSRRRP